jgi:hypothetical protein
MRKATNVFRLPPGESMLNVLYKEYQRAAKTRGRIWNISKDKFRELTKGNCYYCGSPPSTIMDTSKYSKSKGNHVQGIRRCNGSYIYNGIDRVDNLEHYTEDNSITCCKSCNIMKHTKTQDEFIQKCKEIANNFQNKYIHL